ncbi:MAG: sugar ABC transporter permease [Desulfobacteraceae bacterium]|nr:sugar ABC transporter permease [Desulfobacteraceae bacterium]
MTQERTEDRLLQKALVGVGRLFFTLFVPVTAFFIFFKIFIFLRDGNAPQLVMTLIAIVWGVGGVAALYFLGYWLISKLSGKWNKSLLPYLFVGPALVILAWYLFIPTLRSLYLSFFNDTSMEFVGLANFLYCFTDEDMLISYRNNLIWLIVGTSFASGFGLLIAILADRSKFEKISKILIFLPMAISFVGAGVIWRFVYEYKPAGEDQIGLLNAIYTAFGGTPQAWLMIQPWNTVFLVFIMVWMWTGYAMVIYSAAIKGVPVSLIEAGRVDGAGEIRIIAAITIPYIKGTIIAVSTTILIITLKIFDIVYTMTGGLFDTDVVASMQYKQMFAQHDFGMGSAIAVLLFIAIIPVMYLNLRQFGQQEGFK